MTLNPLNNDFLHKGYCFIAADHYLSKENASSLHDLKKLFDEELQEDGIHFRKRAYLKLDWNKLNDKIYVCQNQDYFQSANANRVDGGKIRQFKMMPVEVLNILLMQNIILKNKSMIRNYPPLKLEANLTIGLHFIRYEATQECASYSSPDWLHKDDEPLVFIHLVELSKAALGGDNLIADSETRKVTHVIKLENDIDTLVLNKNVFHAVTPLGARAGIVRRDVILFTIEPTYTQHAAERGFQ